MVEVLCLVFRVRHGLGRWDLLAADKRLGLGAKLAVAAVEKRSRGGGGKAAQGDKDLPNGALGAALTWLELMCPGAVCSVAVRLGRHGSVRLACTANMRVLSMQGSTRSIAGQCSLPSSTLWAALRLQLCSGLATQDCHVPGSLKEVASASIAEEAVRRRGTSALLNAMRTKPSCSPLAAPAERGIAAMLLGPVT